ncbi:MAG: hypothetical protein JWP01_2495 [Myxococcales bacterium]|nr:hypothetical protein [Myxococcales bacterium]
MMTSPVLFSADDARVLCFARSWSVDSLDAKCMQAIRERVRSLGTELIVLGERGVWSFRADDEDFGAYTDRLAGDIATAATLYAARSGGDAVFVICGGAAVRVGHTAQNLAEALDAAAELLIRRRLVVASAASANSNIAATPSVSWRPETSSVTSYRSRV